MTARDRKALLAGGAILIIAFVVTRVIPAAYSGWTSLNDRLDQQRRLLAETRIAIGELPRMETEMRQLTGAVSRTAPMLLSGANPGEATRDLSARLGSIAALEHAAVVGITEVPDSVEAGSLRRLTANAVVQSDFRGVARILERLANDSLSTVVERLRITGAEPRAAVNVPERLQVELRITAWYLAREQEG